MLSDALAIVRRWFTDRRQPRALLADAELFERYPNRQRAADLETLGPRQ